MASKKDLLERMQKSKHVVRRRRSADAEPAPAEKRAAPEPAPTARKTVIRRRRPDRGGGRSSGERSTPPVPVPATETPRPGSSLRRLDTATVDDGTVTPSDAPESGAVPESLDVEASEAVPVEEPSVQLEDAPASPEPGAPEVAAAQASEPEVAKVEAAEASKPEVAEAGAAGDTGDAPAEPKPARSRETKPTETPARSRLPRLPGLGSAVVSPPPGYDPNNPDAWRRRQEAQRARAQALGQTQLGNMGGRGETPARPAKPEQRARPDAKKKREERAPARRPRPKRRGMRERQVMDRVPRVRKPKRRKGPMKPSPPPKAQKRKILVDNSVSLKQMAHEMGVKASQVLKVLLSLDVMCTINDHIDFETAQLVGQEFEYEIVNVGFQEDQVLIQPGVEEEDPDAVSRPPVVTIMGHVDHGKTTLLDTVRETEVAASEAGGITQHIGAYQVDRAGQIITFIDTPGHAAFTEMRARGANATDIVILVVAADDGVMPQTIESINHTKAAGVPIIVAINKCDKAGVKPEVIRQKLMEYELVGEEYGGETMMVNISALKGDGVDELLDAVLLVSEIAEFKANTDRHAEGVVLEARVERGRGSVATLLVQKGTLRPKDPLVLGQVWGKVRAMNDYTGSRIKFAGPSTPVEVIGLDEVPAAGDTFVVVKSEKDARALASHRVDEAKKNALTSKKKLTLQELFARRAEGEQEKLNLILRTDVQGSLEAIRGAVMKIDVEGADVEILHSAVGAVSESDITLAATYNGIVIGFNVRPDPKARRLAESKEVEVRHYKVIYEMLEDLENALTGLLAPIYEEDILGHTEVRAIFNIPKVGTVAGCYVVDGKVMRGAKVRLTRQGVVVYDGKLNSLRRFKEDVREVQNGYECGLGLENFNDIKVGDELECYKVVQVARS